MGGLPAARVPGRGRWLDWPAKVRRCVAGAYVAVLTWALLAPASTFDALDDAFPAQDKMVHGMIFVALALLVRWALPEEWRRGRRRTAVLAALLCYGVAMEGLQAVVVSSQRTFEWLDIVSNQAGLCAGWFFPVPFAGDARESGPAGDEAAAGIGTTIRRRAVR